MVLISVIEGEKQVVNAANGLPGFVGVIQVVCSKRATLRTMTLICSSRLGKCLRMRNTVPVSKTRQALSANRVLWVSQTRMEEKEPPSI